MERITLSPTQSSEGGFSLVELMIALLVSVVIMSGAAQVMTGAQRTYQHQLDDVTVEQEVRFSLTWIRRTLENIGSNPYSVATTTCVTPGTIQAFRMDPNGNGANDDIRVQADAGIPDGFIIGSTGSCTQPDEDVTIALNSAGKTITRHDRGTDASPQAWTDSVITNLRFDYLDGNMATTATVGSVRYIRVTISGQSKKPNPSTGRFTEFTEAADVRLRVE
jgi:prepilin-type N-terminal cleavage/methylation domain-containing protein